MAESKRPEGSIWAVVSGADGRRYLGYALVRGPESSEEENYQGVDVYLATELVIRPVQVQTEEGVVTVHKRGLAPVDGCLSPPTVYIRGSYTLIDIDGLSVEDKGDFQGMLKDAEKGMLNARAKRSGIVTAAPGGPSGGPIIHP